MTYAAFKALVDERCLDWGAQTNEDRDSLYNALLREWARETKYWFKSGIAFSIPANQVQPYSLNDAFYTYKGDPVTPFEIVDVRWRDARLQPIGLDNVLAMAPLATEGAPNYWVMCSAAEWQAFPRWSTTEVQTGVMAAFCYPEALALDADVLDMPDEMIRPFADYCAAEVLSPLAKGDQLRYVESLRKRTMESAAKWRVRNESPDVSETTEVPEVYRLG